MIVTIHRRVSMVDVDLVQINFSRFFPWMDAAYGELLVKLGHPLSQLVAQGNATPAVKATCDYRRPLNLDEEFTLRAGITRVGNASYTLSGRFEDATGLFALAAIDYVWITTSPRHQALPVPTWIRESREPDFLKGTNRS
jgi:YbgC/YbaW family acyl-CoA thioester hydrolase